VNLEYWVGKLESRCMNVQAEVKTLRDINSVLNGNPFIPNLSLSKIKK
jgi:hypothetical protein